MSGDEVKVEIIVDKAPQVATTLTLTYGTPSTTKTVNIGAFADEGKTLSVYVTVTGDTTFTLTAANT